MSGWIKLHRELLNKTIWQNSTSEQKTILITLLLMANHDKKEWEFQGQKYICQPGQFITSLPSIVEATYNCVSIQNVRTALARFEKLGFLTDKSTNKNRLITICNWEAYQSKETRDNSQINSQLTGNQQAANRQLTSNKNDKEIKEENKDAEIVKLKDIPEGLTIPKKLEDIKFPFDSPEFNHAWLSWLSYRKESKIKAYQPVGLQHALSHLSNLAGGDEKKAIKIIQLSIANGWQGFFKLNEDKPLNRALTPADGDAYFKRAIV